VGYRNLYQLDHTRQYDPEFATDPRKPPVHKPRPIYICVWYPAQKTDTKPMEYRHYLDVSSDDALIAQFLKRLSRHVVNVVSDTTVGAEPANRTPAETAAFVRLMATKTFAVKDAPPAEGRFPVVLNHAGLNGVSDDNSVLFELLASHGYVVLSSAYQTGKGDIHLFYGLIFSGTRLICTFAYPGQFTVQPCFYQHKGMAAAERKAGKRS
jgi:hypothetical protein